MFFSVSSDLQNFSLQYPPSLLRLSNQREERIVAKGQAKHQTYVDALNLLGKDLARRAKSKCELSGESGRLEIYDLEGPDKEPAMEHVVLVSEEVAGYLGGRPVTGGAVRYLENIVWSTEPAIRRAAVLILERIDESWALEAIDNAKTMDG